MGDVQGKASVNFSPHNLSRIEAWKPLTPSLICLITFVQVGIHFSILSKTNVMNNLLYLIAVVLIILWLLGYFMYSAGNLIHILLVIAIVAVLFRVIKGDRN